MRFAMAYAGEQPSPEFMKRNHAVLQEGDALMYACLFAGIFEDDRREHQAIAQGEPPSFVDGHFTYTTRTLAANGVYLTRLRVLPEEGFNGTTAEDLSGEVQMQALLQAAGQETRFVSRRLWENALKLGCGSASPHVQRYLADPTISRESFWFAARRTTAGQDLFIPNFGSYVLDQARVVDYNPPGTEPELVSSLHIQPFDRHFRNYVQCALDVFHNTTLSFSLDQTWDELVAGRHQRLAALLGVVGSHVHDGRFGQ